MHDLHHHCKNALVGMLPHIKAYRKATNEIIAEKEWQAILAAIARIEDALDAHRENGKDG